MDINKFKSQVSKNKYALIAVSLVLIAIVIGLLTVTQLDIDSDNPVEEEPVDNPVNETDDNTTDDSNTDDNNDDNTTGDNNNDDQVTVNYNEPPNCQQVDYNNTGDVIRITDVYELQCIGITSDAPQDADYVLQNDINASYTQEWDVLRYVEGSSVSEYNTGYILEFNDKEPVDLMGVYDFATDRPYSIDQRKTGSIIEENGTRRIVLNESIDGQIYAEYEVDENVGFEPIIVQGHFTGSFDGGNHSINNLEISDTSESALFAEIGENGVVKNLNINNVTVTVGEQYASAGSVAVSNQGTVKNVDVNGVLDGEKMSAAGGIIGVDQTGTVRNVSFEGTINGHGHIGGLIGKASDTSIKNSKVHVEITADDRAGGIIGYGLSGTSITQTGVKGEVTAKLDEAGGIAGSFTESQIINSYAQVDVSSTGEAGGLVGDSSYATVEKSYTTGTVNGNDQSGALMGGYGSGLAEDTYWSSNTGLQRGQANGGSMIQDDNMRGDKAAEYMDGFDFNNIWRTVEGDYPELR